MEETVACEKLPVVRYTWPGRDEAFACVEHAIGIQAVAQAMGLYLQMIPLSGAEQTRVSCSSKERANKSLKPTAKSAAA